MSKSELGALKSLDDRSLADLVALEVGSIGENMALRRVVHLQASPTSQIKTYIHVSGESSHVRDQNLHPRVRWVVTRPRSKPTSTCQVSRQISKPTSTCQVSRQISKPTSTCQVSRQISKPTSTCQVSRQIVKPTSMCQVSHHTSEIKTYIHVSGGSSNIKTYIHDDSVSSVHTSFCQSVAVNILIIIWISGFCY